jgi:hypothetical protein
MLYVESGAASMSRRLGAIKSGKAGQVHYQLLAFRKRPEWLQMIKVVYPGTFDPITRGHKTWVACRRIVRRSHRGGGGSRTQTLSH